MWVDPVVEGALQPVGTATVTDPFESPPVAAVYVNVIVLPVEAVLTELEEAFVASRTLRGDYAFHSPLVEGMLDDFHESVVFARPETHAVVATVEEGNRRSWRAFEKAGFRRAGFVTVHGQQAIRFVIMRTDGY